MAIYRRPIPKKEKQGFWFRGERKLYLNANVSYLERGEGNFSFYIKKQ
jgi:hypothetical protein